MGKKKFIDKKSSAHFHLVRRSQRDPLIADENSSQFVLVPAGGRQKIPSGIDYDHGEFPEGEDGNEYDEDELALQLEQEMQLAEGEDPNDEDHKDEDDRDEAKEGDKKKPQLTKGLLPVAVEKGKGNGKGKMVDKANPSETMGEAAKYGIMFDDREYDYTQHLKEMGAPGGVFIAATNVSTKKNPYDIFLPEEVLPSKYEEEIGMLNLAVPITGPRPDLGEEVLEVLEALEDEAFEGDFDDDFFQELDKTPSESENEDEGGSDVDSEGGACGDDMEEGHRSRRRGHPTGDFDDDEPNFETRSRFTNYSMTSSILSRTKEMQFLDEKFDKLMEDYGDEEIGELNDDSTVNGTRNIEVFDSVLDEFLEEHTEITYKGALEKPGQSTKDETKKLVLQSLEAMESAPQIPQRVAQKAKPAWDCESYLSTYSNLENHPGLIREKPKKQIVLNKSGMPVGFEHQSSKKQTTAAVVTPAAEKDVPEGEKPSDSHTEEDSEEGSDAESTETAVTGAARSKNETAEERRERKKAVKEQKWTRRQEKKTTKTAFKNEKLRQEKVKMQKAVNSPQVVHIH